jgi:hypothetical protein
MESALSRETPESNLSLKKEIHYNIEDRGK